MLHSQAGGHWSEGVKTGEKMDLAGDKDAHQQTGTSCIKTSFENIHKNIGNRFASYSGGKTVSLMYLLKIGSYAGVIEVRLIHYDVL